jgi:ABC-2 type transport system ATP-binding protein
MEQNAITIKNFSKSFGELVVIEDLSFDVQAGEIFAFLGANGSGKTTTIRSLLNIYQPDKGELLVFGNRYQPEHSSLLGYLPEERGLYLNSKVLETMVYMGELKGMPRELARKNSMAYLERVELADKAKLQIKQLSSGQQQKIQLGITVINKPKLLILDEPTKGLDPVNRNLMLEILHELNREQNTTILFSTHQMEEAEKIANRLLMIKNGKKVLYGHIDDVKNSFGKNTIHIRFTGKFPQEPKLFTAKIDTNTAELTPLKDINSDQIMQHLIKSDLIIHEFQIGAPSLNEIFIKVSEGDY